VAKADQKQQSSPAANNSDVDLASELFVKAWALNTPIKVEYLAEQCFVAAEAFNAVADKIRNGNSAEDLIAERQLSAETVPAEPQNAGGDSTTK